MKRWPKHIRPKLPHEDIAIYELGNWEAMPYCIGLVEKWGWVVLNRHYHKVDGGGHLCSGDGPPPHGGLQFHVDPREAGVFALVEGNYGFFYDQSIESSVVYFQRLARLWALAKSDCGQPVA